MHGLLLACIEDHFLELAELESRVSDGGLRHGLDPEPLKMDLETRMAISAEFGHGDEEFTAVYLGQ